MHLKLATLASRPLRCLPLLAATVLLAACATQRPDPGATGNELSSAEAGGWGWAVAVPQTQEVGIEGAHPSLRPVHGSFDCDLKRKVMIHEVAGTDRKVVVHWAGKDHMLDVVRTPSGALRYQNEASGLTWIIIPAKSMLLDTRSGRQLANDCRPAA
ncbi:MAG TPA: hypothetical protein PK177_19315 [Burkholderiaceae bacterium]|nr:hypothetical protein [Burkholderiaceae bacterium]